MSYIENFGITEQEHDETIAEFNAMERADDWRQELMGEDSHLDAYYEERTGLPDFDDFQTDF